MIDATGIPPLGTPEHWIYKMPLTAAALGAKMKHQMSQAELLKPKIPEAKRKNMKLHQEGVRAAQCLLDEVIGNQTENELDDTVTLLGKIAFVWGASS